ncbi:MAG: hypothetical protein HW380_1233 [Magnetococcales bacterium]|nr:hypothetical protein [Magnetococcales bacterium]HIJ84939.1 LbtU family siderophore porin [Magnetococcales bacterium]
MKKFVLSALIPCLAIGATVTAYAEEPPSREEMWKMLQEQQREIAALKKQLGEAAAAPKSQVAVPAAKSEPAKEGGIGLKWSDRITFSGTVEVAANWNNNHDGDFTTPRSQTSDVTVATAELAAEAKINNWAKGKVVLLHEEAGADKEIDVDEATITIANPEVTPAFLSGGLMTLPFGSYETFMVSDPLTLDLGETTETALRLGFEHSHYSGSVFAFNGEAEKTGTNSHLRGVGANLAYNRDYDIAKVHVGSDIISALDDSNGITDSPVDETTMQKHLPGLSLHTRIGVGPVTALAEYVGALKRFDSSEMLWNTRGARPWAFNSELGYAWDLMGHQGTVAAGYQQTAEAGGLMLPKRRFRGGVNWSVFEDTELAFEWAHDRDYNAEDSSSVEGGLTRMGTGEKSNSATLQLAVGF